MEPQTTWENTFDPHAILKRILTLGFWLPPWENKGKVKYPSIGCISSDYFRPEEFKPHTPNPAFENCTNRDGFWGAKIASSFSDEQIEAAVEAGQYSNPDAAAYLVQVLKERRDKIGRYWFSQINTLDRFTLKNGQNGSQSLTFIDWPVESNLESIEGTRYRYDFRIGGKLILENQEIQSKSSMPLPDIYTQRQYLDSINPKDKDGGQWEIKIHIFRDSTKKRSKWVKIYMDRDSETGRFTLLGIRRQE
jgi:hypothetical protein